MTIHIIQMTQALPVDALEPLLVHSREEGFNMVERLIQHWQSGDNRFDKPGEALFVARQNQKIVGIGGRNIDPYATIPGIARVRHLYVLPSCRGQGIGTLLMRDIMNVPPGLFTKMTLRTHNPEACRFYRGLGFSSVEEENITHQILLSI